MKRDFLIAIFVAFFCSGTVLITSRHANDIHQLQKNLATTQEALIGAQIAVAGIQEIQGIQQQTIHHLVSVIEQHDHTLTVMLHGRIPLTYSNEPILMQFDVRSMGTNFNIKGTK